MLMSLTRVHSWYRDRRSLCWSTIGIMAGFGLLTFLRVPVVLAGAGVGFALGFEFEPMIPGFTVLLLQVMAFSALGIQLALHLGPDEGRRVHRRHRQRVTITAAILALIFVWANIWRSISLMEVVAPLTAALTGGLLGLRALMRPLGRARLVRISWSLFAGCAAAVFVYTNTGVGRRVKTETMEQLDALRELHTEGKIAGDELGDWLQAAFAVARQRSEHGGPIRRNRAALLALGYVLGHEEVATRARIPIAAETAQWAERVRGSVRLRNRGDWPRHFAVSASLSVMRDLDLSDGVGHLKEARDSMGGSGFSFSDILANQAGILLAVKATRKRADAYELQNRAAAGLPLESYHPDPDGLPPDMQRDVFRRDFGGIGGAGYTRVMADIQVRLKSCDALW
jgi:hypothetical protein